MSLIQISGQKQYKLVKYKQEMVTEEEEICVKRKVSFSKMAWASILI